MKKTYEMFLEAFKAALHNSSVNWSEEVTGDEWREIFRLAAQHRVLPMVYEAVYSCPAASADKSGTVQMQRRAALQTMILQTQKTSEFLRIYQAMRRAGAHPIVVKGIICRSYYPKPDLRYSGDEDVLVPSEEFLVCHRVLKEVGMAVSDTDLNIETAYEVSYEKQGSPIYIELHKSLFSPEEVYGDLNRYFTKVHSHREELVVEGVNLYTMQPTEYLFYLICHAFKHFLHSGVGIRQVADIALYANARGAEIDWDTIRMYLREMRADRFALALMRIGEQYLTLDVKAACLPQEWLESDVDETAMLMDILAGGVYGDATMSRKHSSTITLHAMTADKKGKKSGGKGLVARSIFPSLREMQSRFPWLEKAPVLLPVGWALRILRYRKEVAAGSKSNTAAEAMRIGKERIELLREYGVLEVGKGGQP